MNKYPFWLMSLLCLIGLATWMLMKKKVPKEIWETTSGGPYQVIVTEESISCVHPQRATEMIRWEDIDEVRLVTTSDGPFLPDQWYLFIRAGRGCSVPSEAQGFDVLLDAFKTRFPGLDYQAILDAGTSEEERVLWTKSSVPSTQ